MSQVYLVFGIWYFRSGAVTAGVGRGGARRRSIHTTPRARCQSCGYARAHSPAGGAHPRVCVCAFASGRAQARGNRRGTPPPRTHAPLKEELEVEDKQDDGDERDPRAVLFPHLEHVQIPRAHGEALRLGHQLARRPRHGCAHARAARCRSEHQDEGAGARPHKRTQHGNAPLASA